MKKLSIILILKLQNPHSEIPFKYLLESHKKGRIKIDGVIAYKKENQKVHLIKKIGYSLYRNYRKFIRLLILKKLSLKYVNCIERCCKKYDIPLLLAPNKDINHLEVINFCKESKPDMIINMGNHQILKSDLFNCSKLATLNIHSSYLPKYAGACPLMWPMLKGEKYAGVSIHHINEKIDYGGIVIREKIKINKNDDLESLDARAFEIRIKLIGKLIHLAIKGSLPFIPNKPEKRSFYTFKQSDEINLIDFNKKGEEISRLCKILGRFIIKKKDCVLSIENIKFFKCEDLKNYKNGQVSNVLFKGLAVKVSNGYLLIRSIFYFPAFLTAKIYKIKKGDMLKGYLQSR